MSNRQSCLQEAGIVEHSKAFNEEIFDVGFRNFPRTDNWMQEDRIFSYQPSIEIPLCSYNGCELIENFLGKKQDEVEKEELEAIVLGEILFREQQISILQEKIKKFREEIS